MILIFRSSRSRKGDVYRPALVSVINNSNSNLANEFSPTNKVFLWVYPFVTILVTILVLSKQRYICIMIFWTFKQCVRLYTGAQSQIWNTNCFSQ